METTSRPFEFKQCVAIIKSTGKSAKDLRELRDGIATVSEESIFHHTYQYFLKRHILDYSNDFAHWAGQSLEERALSEYFSNIDQFAFKSIGDLRGALLKVIDDYLGKFHEPRPAMPGNEFYFNEAVTFIFPAGFKASNLAEFLMAVKYIDTPCIYYHFYEARMRLGSGVDDFSTWIGDSLGRKDLSAKIEAIDPLMHTLEGVKETLAEVIEEGARKEMEAMLQ